MKPLITKDGLVQLAVRWFFVIIPTAITGYVTIRYVNLAYTYFNSTVVNQSLYFFAGLTFSYALYYFRARWIVTLVLLWLVYWVAGKIVSRLPGEFDVFYATAKYQLYSALFLCGWIFGLLLVRLRWAYIVLCGVLAVTTLVAVSNTVDVSLRYMLLHLVPVALYGLYMLFLSPLLADTREMNARKSVRLVLRFAVFLILVLLAFVFVERLFQEDLKAVEKELVDRGAKDNGKNGDDKKDKGGYDDRFGLMDKPGGKGDDGYRLKDTMKINSKMSQSDRLMFCARIDSYFPDGTPKPFYFVYHYLTRYDPAKETFTRDVNVPYFDEFDADPSQIPMYHYTIDTTIIGNSLGHVGREVVESEVYLSENTWKHALLAPASAFYCQTLPIEKDFQKMYYAAYKVKSYASDLNYTLFVYNPTAHPALESIQQARFEALRVVRNYRGADRDFMNYYTRMPTGPLYDSIARLANSLSTQTATPLEKVLAVRDYFMRRDENGKRIFRYTLKPGGVDDPNIPSASMLGNFLFKTHAGYCTYYAGASLFLLRSLGIPARFTTGFATVNRSDKNKGWYWFYASQAHAWTQVYFPRFGWMDFDMTIGNEDQQGAPRPDGTPPLPPPQPWLVLNAKADSAPDEKKKSLDVSFSQLIYLDKPYQLNDAVRRSLDASRCRVLYDKKDTTLACIVPGDSLIVVSYKDEGRQIPAERPGVPIEVQVAGFPIPIIADEIHIKPRPVVAKKDDAKKKPLQEEENPLTWQEIARAVAWFAGSVVVLAFLMPLLWLLVLLVRTALARDPERKADRVYQEALYRLHMSGLERGGETPLEYAQSKADPAYHAGFADFMRVYLHLKYSREEPTPGDNAVVARFAKKLGPAIRQHRGTFRSFFNYFNLLLALRYFLQPEPAETETQNSIP